MLDWLIPRRSGSLTHRLVAILALWTLLANLATAFAISTYFRTSAKQDFSGLLLAHAHNLMGAVEIGEEGRLQGMPNLGDPRFLQPGSGWYWAVTTATEPTRPILHSQSIDGSVLPMPDGLPAFNDLFRRTYSLDGEGGSGVQRMEAQLFFGDSPTLHQVTVAGSLEDLEANIAAFNRSLFFFLAIYGVGTLLAVWFVVRFGLQPLRDAARELVAVRQGQADRLSGEFPAEIEPFVSATNDFIAANRSVVDRARTQVGNLAHALKTPLAVILNETEGASGSAGGVIRQQAHAMQHQVRTYLDKARLAAKREAGTSRSPANATVRKMTETLGKLFRDIEFEYVPPNSELLFRGEEQDLQEILGNLLENAGRHAASRVRVTLREGEESAARLFLTVEDDGPGIPDERRRAVLERGTRLDERKPGSGLGLSIVQDTVYDYNGSMELGTSELGGLMVTIVLPASASSPARDFELDEAAE